MHCGWYHDANNWPAYVIASLGCECAVCLCTDCFIMLRRKSYWRELQCPQCHGWFVVGGVTYN